MVALEDPFAGAVAEGPEAGVGLQPVQCRVVGRSSRITLSKSQPWATLYQPMNLMPYFASYSRTWRGNSVFM